MISRSILSRLILAKAIFLFVTISCKKNQEVENKPEYKENIIQGIWKSIGYGKVLKIAGDNYQIYETTNISCLPQVKGKYSDLKDAIVLLNDTLTYIEGINAYTYKRVDELPLSCGRTLLIDQKNDPVYNFEVFAETFKTHHAYFELNKTNWDSIYQNTKSKIDASTSEAELFSIWKI